MFNDSLLAKQTWCLLHNKDSLFYKVFKARFFPNYSIMKAKESSSGSYAWQSILYGRDVIHRGVHQHIRTSRKVRVWQHHWLPRKHPPLLYSPVVEGLEDATVDLLIEIETRTWNVELIYDLFTPQEAQLIKSIPLARSSAKEPHSSNGRYSCKTRYRFLKEEAGLTPFMEPVNTQL